MLLPITGSDIVKALEVIPLWKALIGLPKRVAELEAKVAALEASKAERQGPPATACPKCGTQMKVEKETAHPDFDFAGVKIHHMRCPSCGVQATREFNPGKGYG